MTAQIQFKLTKLQMKALQPLFDAVLAEHEKGKRGMILLQPQFKMPYHEDNDVLGGFFPHETAAKLVNISQEANET